MSAAIEIGERPSSKRRTQMRNERTLTVSVLEGIKRGEQEIRVPLLQNALILAASNMGLTRDDYEEREVMPDDDPLEILISPNRVRILDQDRVLRILLRRCN
jgi:hypothetical protein